MTRVKQPHDPGQAVFVSFPEEYRGSRSFCVLWEILRDFKNVSGFRSFFGCADRSQIESKPCEGSRTRGVVHLGASPQFLDRRGSRGGRTGAGDTMPRSCVVLTVSGAPRWNYTVRLKTPELPPPGRHTAPRNVTEFIETARPYPGK